jgi:hypothetical protein
MSLWGPTQKFKDEEFRIRNSELRIGKKYFNPYRYYFIKDLKKFQKMFKILMNDHLFDNKCQVDEIRIHNKFAVWIRIHNS